MNILNLSDDSTYTQFSSKFAPACFTMAILLLRVLSVSLCSPYCFKMSVAQLENVPGHCQSKLNHTPTVQYKKIRLFSFYIRKRIPP